jgi:hypothetical protein
MITKSLQTISFIFLFINFALCENTLKDESAITNDSLVSSNYKWLPIEYSLGLFYSHYAWSSNQEDYPGLNSLRAYLYNLSFKYRYSLFEARLGVGFGNINQTRTSYQVFNVPNAIPKQIVENINDNLFSINLQARIFFNKDTRLNPFLCFGFDILSFRNNDVFYFGMGFHYRITKILSAEATAAFSLWNEDAPDDSKTFLPVYFEVGVNTRLASHFSVVKK